MNSPLLPARRNRRNLALLLKKVASFCFAALLLLTFITPSWRYGPFAWLPIRSFAFLAGGPVELGLLNLLPLVMVGTWLSGRFIAWRWEAGTQAKWRWGRPGITLPLLGLTLLGVFSLDTLSPRRTFIHAGALALAWLVYLFMINEKPRLTFVLATVALVQGSVSIAQFLGQADLGIRLLGELPLNPIHGGVSVLWARDQLWLRGYGLTAHPNLLGAILAAILLLLLPAYKRAGGRKGIGLFVAFNIGLLGLLFTFSRAAGLAFVVGLIAWLLLEARCQKLATGKVYPKLKLRNPRLLLPLLIGAIFLLSFGDIAMSRVLALDTPTEAQSVAERISASGQAVDIITNNILTGVGLGNYSSAAGTLFEGAVRVHNVPLLVTAELGILGLIFWLCLAIFPFQYYLINSRIQSRVTRSPSRPLSARLLSATHPLTEPTPVGPTPVDHSPAHRADSCRPDSCRPLTRSPLHVWLAVLLIGLFDTTLWLTSNWQTAILFALIVALLAQDN